LRKIRKIKLFEDQKPTLTVETCANLTIEPTMQNLAPKDPHNWQNFQLLEKSV